MKLFGVKLGTGFWVGAGVVVLAPVVLPVATSLLRSLTKATIKGTLIAYQKAKVVTAETMESLEDLAAEAKSEIGEEPKAETPKKPEPKTAAAKS